MEAKTEIASSNAPDFSFSVSHLVRVTLMMDGLFSVKWCFFWWCKKDKQKE